MVLSSMIVLETVSTNEISNPSSLFSTEQDGGIKGAVFTYYIVICSPETQNCDCPVVLHSMSTRIGWEMQIRFWPSGSMMEGSCYRLKPKTGFRQSLLGLCQVFIARSRSSAVKKLSFAHFDLRFSLTLCCKILIALYCLAWGARIYGNEDLNTHDGIMANMSDRRR